MERVRRGKGRGDRSEEGEAEKERQVLRVTNMYIEPSGRPNRKVVTVVRYCSSIIERQLM